jgi:hypothetical protein
MGIDYVIALDCEPKEALGIEEIVAMVKARSRAETILALARRDGDQRPAHQITFGIQLYRNGEVTSEDASVQSLLDQAAALDDHVAACRDCPANRDNPTGYGCYKSIAYPIEPDIENWLLTRLPAALDETNGAGYLLARALEDFGWDGAQAADMRSQGERFFRLREAPVRRWPNGIEISSDQLFHMMFHVGHLNPDHSRLLCMFFGLVPIGDAEPPDDDTPLESQSAQAMVDWINSLVFAAANQLELLVDG